jgi:hypothetical protein
MTYEARFVMWQATQRREKLCRIAAWTTPAMRNARACFETLVISTPSKADKLGARCLRFCGLLRCDTIAAIA